MHSGVNIHGFLLCPQRGRPHPKYFKAGYRQCQKSGRIAVMTFSGGAGIVSSDLLDHHGLTLASLSDGAVTALGKIFPAWMPVSNPVDLWPAIERSDVNTAYRHTIQALCADPTVDAVLLHTFAGGPRWQINLRPIVEIARAKGKPLFLWMIGKEKGAKEFKQEAAGLQVPVHRALSRAVRMYGRCFVPAIEGHSLGKG